MNRSRIVTVLLGAAAVAYLALGEDDRAEPDATTAAAVRSQSRAQRSERPALTYDAPAAIATDDGARPPLPPAPPAEDDTVEWPIVAQPEPPAYLDGLPTPVARGEAMPEDPAANVSEPTFDHGLVITIDPSATDADVDALMARHGLVELRRIGELRRIASLDDADAELLRDQLAGEPLITIN